MAPCCLVPPASVAGAGRDLCGSTVTLTMPPMRDSAKLVCRLRLVSQMSNGCQKRVLLLHQTPVRNTFILLTSCGMTLEWRTEFVLLCRFLGVLGTSGGRAAARESFHQTWAWPYCHHCQPRHWSKQCCHRQHGLQVICCFTLMHTVAWGIHCWSLVMIDLHIFSIPCS